MSTVSLYTNLVVSASENQVALHFFRPDVMGVVWQGAWSKASLAFAKKLACREFVPIGERFEDIRFEKIKGLLQSPEAKPFREDLTKFESLFNCLGIGLDPLPVAKNFSRIEPNNDGRSSGWHVDPASLAMLSVPSGITTDYVDGTIEGQFLGAQFRYANAERLASHVKRLQHDEVLIFKGADYPEMGTNHGLVHRRPKLDLSTPGQSRVVIHYQQ